MSTWIGKSLRNCQHDDRGKTAGRRDGQPCRASRPARVAGGSNTDQTGPGLSARPPARQRDVGPAASLQKVSERLARDSSSYKKRSIARRERLVNLLWWKIKRAGFFPDGHLTSLTTWPGAQPGLVCLLAEIAKLPGR
jgi:hypothetical protein